MQDSSKCLAHVAEDKGGVLEEVSVVDKGVAALKSHAVVVDVECVVFRYPFLAVAPVVVAAVVSL